MSNKYLSIVKSAGIVSGVRQGWRDATPSQRLLIGLSGTGGTLSAANMTNSGINAYEAKKKTDLDEKSLKALHSINRSLKDLKAG